ncbi:restriction endonuclease subunit S [Neisseria sp. P0005.S008]|uniref:restriction endonuclease subunit S n=1 Tax=Neisseria sp. P0005.S008 TaxID=3436682 RepID=UPI003F80B40B
MNKQQEPRLRFKGFTGAWEEKRLSDVVEIVGGGTPDTNNSAYWGGEIDWYSPTEIGENVYANGSIRKITLLGLQKSSAVILPADRTVLFTSRASIGDMAILTKQGATNQGFQSFIVREGLNIYFLYTMGFKIKEYALKNASGSTFLEISKTQLLQMESLFPSLTEQTHLGLFFRRLDSQIAESRAVLEKSRQLKKAMLAKMFPANGEKIPKIRFKGFEGEWEEKMLGENANFTKGCGYSKSDLTEDGFPIILYGRLYTQYENIIEDVDTFVSYDDSALKSQGNEVIMPASGETAEDIVRASAVYQRGVILGGDLNVITPNKEIFSTFLALTLTNGRNRQELAKKAQGKSVVHLRNDDLKSCKILFPSLAEQTQIGNFFRQLDETIALQSAEVEKLNQLKKGLLAAMLV